MAYRRVRRALLRDWSEPTNLCEARIFLGRQPGMSAEHGRPDCPSGGHVYSAEDATRAFVHARQATSEGIPGATTVEARGYWAEGRELGHEESTMIVSSYIPSPAEKTCAKFKDNTLRAVEDLAERLCQKCVYVQFAGVRRDGKTQFYKVSGPGRPVKQYCG